MNTKPVGNKTPRRGRKLRRDIHLSQESAHALRILWLAQTNNMSEDAIVAALIEAAWRELDQAYAKE